MILKRCKNIRQKRDSGVKPQIAMEDFQISSVSTSAKKYGITLLTLQDTYKREDVTIIGVCISCW